MLLAGVLLVAVTLAFAAGVGCARVFTRDRATFIQREKQVTIDFLKADRETARERIRQLEHSLDEARTAALNLTPPAVRDATLAAAQVAERGYDADLTRELDAITDASHRAEYEETIRQMRLERPDISDKEIRLTLFA